MTAAFVLTGCRIAHDRAPVSVLEAASYDDPGARLRELTDRDGVAESYVLQTCNRVEEYVVAETSAAGEAALEDVVDELGAEHVVRTGHEASLRHLLRVAAGLESQVLGEDQILGQVREAYLEADEVGTVGPVLEAALLKAIHVGERARTETAINDGRVSLGSAAVDLAEREVGLEGETVVVVGAGETAGVIANRLAEAELETLYLVNRSPDRARALAESLDVPVTVDSLDGLADRVASASVLFSAVAARESLVEFDDLEGTGPIRLFDLGQPRNIDPSVGELPDVELHDLDALEAVTARTHEDRQAAADAVEAIIDEEYALLIDQYKRRRADAVIRGMYQGADRIRDRELATALSKLEGEEALSEEQRAVVEQLSESLVAKLLAVPTKSLREAAAEDDWETVASAIQLFDPSLLEDAPPAERRTLDRLVGTPANAGED